jgi:hypothetical protein
MQRCDSSASIFAEGVAGGRERPPDEREPFERGIRGHCAAEVI